MTKKRFKGFTSSIDYHIVEDTLENRYLSKEDVINALNKFWVQYEYYEKENKQLKETNQKLYDKLQETMSSLKMCEIELIKKENEKERKELQLQMLRLYNYFEDWFEDSMSPNAFSEMWDNVKEDEKWEKR